MFKIKKIKKHEQNTNPIIQCVWKIQHTKIQISFRFPKLIEKTRSSINIVNVSILIRTQLYWRLEQHTTCYIFNRCILSLYVSCPITLKCKIFLHQGFLSLSTTKINIRIETFICYYLKFNNLIHQYKKMNNERPLVKHSLLNKKKFSEIHNKYQTMMPINLLSNVYKIAIIKFQKLWY